MQNTSSLQGEEKWYAMTTEKMLRIAVYEHQRSNHGALPKRIEMHPAVFDDLLSDANFCQYRLLDGPNSPDTFYGVPIVVDVKATRLKLIDVNNEVEYV